MAGNLSASLRSAQSLAVRERDYTGFGSTLLSRISGEAGPSPKGLAGEGAPAKAEKK